MTPSPPRAVLAVGVDVVDVERFAGIMQRHGERLLQRLFTPRERAEATRSGQARAPERFAARFAAKEAALKALGTGWSAGIAWTDIQCHADDRGGPTLTITGAAEVIASQRHIVGWLCSISHTDRTAFATVIAIG